MLTRTRTFRTPNAPHARLLAGLVAIAAAACLGSSALASDRAPDHAADAQGDKGDHPRIFANLTYPEALKANKTDGKLLVVKATAVWCGPCKMMDKTTWRDASVEKFFADKGVVISLDVDKDEASARELRIRAMPTMVALRKGVEIDRVVGYKSADDLLAWLADVESGETGASRLEKRLKLPREGDGALTMQERMALASDLVDAGRVKEAGDEYVWLWENMLRVEPAMVGVRGSFLAGAIGQFAQGQPEVKARFAGMRDVIEARLKGPDKSWDDLNDWIVLNEIVGQEDKTLEWFDRIKNDPASEETLERFDYRLEQLLQARGRWADYGRMIKSPLKKLREEQAQAKFMASMSMPGMEEKDKEQMVLFAQNGLREFAGNLYAGLLAAGREDDAKAVCAKAIEGDDTAAMRLALVESALRSGQPREDHRALVAQAAANEADRARIAQSDLDEALKAKK